MKPNSKDNVSKCGGWSKIVLTSYNQNNGWINVLVSKTYMVITFQTWPHQTKDVHRNMVWNWNESSEGTDPESGVKIQDLILINTKHYKYLGVWMGYKKFSIGEKKICNWTLHNSVLDIVSPNTPNWYKTKISRVLFLNNLGKSRFSYECHIWRQTCYKYLNIYYS